MDASLDTENGGYEGNESHVKIIFYPIAFDVDWE